jgi:hypothetical protein
MLDVTVDNDRRVAMTPMPEILLQVAESERRHVNHDERSGEIQNALFERSHAVSPYNRQSY